MALAVVVVFVLCVILLGSSMLTVSLRWRPPGIDLDIGASCLKSGTMIVSAYG
jgi:hypothetical protein